MDNPSLEISKRGRLSPPSPIRKLSYLAEKAKRDGVKVYHLNIGQPDIHFSKTAQPYLNELCKLNHLPYDQSEGFKELILNWQRYLSSIGIEIESDEALITSGASEGLIFAISAVADNGQEIIAFEPFYANYLGFANLVNINIKPVILDAKNHYHLPERSEIEKKITNKTKAILLNNPNNPTGTVFTIKELKILLSIASKYNLFIISDEAYSGICFDEKMSKSIFTIASKKEKERIIIVDSLSKKFNACGARIGALISKNRQLLEAFRHFAQQRLSVAAPDQRIGSLLLLDGKSYISKIAREYENRRNAFIGELENELKTKIHYPEGAFYTMLKLPVKDSDHFSKWLLENFRLNNQTVMVAPGRGFYATPNLGKDEIRVAFVLNASELKKAAKILVAGIKEYLKDNGS